MSSDLIKLIKIKLKQNKITQKELAHIIGKIPSSLNRLLKGGSVLSVPDLCLIAEALGTTAAKLMEEAENIIPKNESLKTENENFVLKSNLTFDLWNILKKRKTIVEIYDLLRNDYSKDEIDLHLKEYMLKKLIKEVGKDLYIVNIKREKSIFFNHTNLYRERKTQLISRCLEKKPNLDESATRRKLWTDKYSDGFFIDYFTAEQSKERKIMIKQLWNYLISQRNINNVEKECRFFQQDDRELRVFGIIDMSYPVQGDT